MRYFDIAFGSKTRKLVAEKDKAEAAKVKAQTAADYETFGKLRFQSDFWREFDDKTLESAK